MKRLSSAKLLAMSSFAHSVKQLLTSPRGGILPRITDSLTYLPERSVKKNHTNAEEIQHQIKVLRIRNTASRIAIKLFENAKDQDQLETIRELLDEAGIYTDMSKVIRARDALIALAVKMNVNLDDE